MKTWMLFVALSALTVPLAAQQAVVEKAVVEMTRDEWMDAYALQAREHIADGVDRRLEKAKSDPLLAKELLAAAVASHQKERADIAIKKAAFADRIKANHPGFELKNYQITAPAANPTTAK